MEGLSEDGGRIRYTDNTYQEVAVEGINEKPSVCLYTFNEGASAGEKC